MEKSSLKSYVFSFLEGRKESEIWRKFYGEELWWTQTLRKIE